jgi:integrase
LIGRPRFVQSLGTEVLATAKRRAAVLHAQWTKEIEEARAGYTEDDAAWWKQALERAQTPKERARVLQQIEMVAEQPVVYSDAQPEGNADQAFERGEDFYLRATGEKVVLADHVEPYLVQADFSPRGEELVRNELKKFVKLHQTPETVTKQKIQGWINILAFGGRNPATIRRKLAAVRGFWEWLRRIEKVPEDANPFDRLHLPKNKAPARLPFTVADVRKLIDSSDGVLQSFILLASHTGARREELCALKVADVNDDTIKIVAGKSKAAIREIPIHRDIRDLVQKLKAESQDGYLFPGFTEDKLGQRGRNVGRRFTDFKRKLGYDDRYVLHSLRMFVSTSLEEAQVPEFTAARILGHAVRTLSYGVYSSGVSNRVKLEALEKAIRL